MVARRRVRAIASFYFRGGLCRTAFILKISPCENFAAGRLSQLISQPSPPRAIAGTSELHLLRNVTASFKAGTSTLVLGAPGSGKSTLLRAVSSRLSAPVAHGTVTVGGLTAEALRAERSTLVRRLTAYAPQTDRHQAFLTVAELLSFAHSNSAAPLPAGASPVASRELSQRAERVISLLGLDECRDTIIGNPIVRGISGGQKRRVTIGESLLAGARVLAGDQITDGLDAAVALEIIAFCGRWARECGGTFVAALQAPTPEIYASFDSVVLLAEGRVLYHGPPSSLEGYLARLGYAQPGFVDTADYAVQVATSPATALSLYADDARERGIVTPRAADASIDALATAWAAGGAAAVEAVAAAGVGVAVGAAPAPLAGAGASAPLSAYGVAQFGRTFAHSQLYHFSLLVGRERRLFSRNIALIMAKLMQSIVMALIFGGVFFNVETYNFYLKVSIAFFASIFVAYSNIAEVPVTVVNKLVVKRHLSQNMYPSVAYMVSLLAVQLPLILVADLIFCVILYFMIGFVRDAGSFFFFYFVLLSLDLCCNGLFKLCVTASTPAPLHAHSRRARPPALSCTHACIHFCAFPWHPGTPTVPPPSPPPPYLGPAATRRCRPARSLPACWPAPARASCSCTAASSFRDSCSFRQATKSPFTSSRPSAGRCVRSH